MKVRLIWHFAIPFALTMLIGLTAFTIGLRNDSPGNTTNLPDRTIESDLSDSNGTRSNPETDSGTESQNINTVASASNHPKMPDGSLAGPSTGTLDSQVGQNETSAQNLTRPTTQTVSTGVSPAVRGLTAVNSESSSVVSGQPIVSSSSASSDSASIDPEGNSGFYPQRRIPWHQGFTVQEQWYRSWYGWTAIDTQEGAALQQSP
jgi:hypothetical protein